MAKGATGNERTVSGDDPMLWAGGAAALYAICWAFWFIGHAKISAAYAYLRYLQVWIFYALGEIWPDLPVVGAIHDWFQALCAPTGLIGRCSRDLSTVAWDEIASSSMLANAFWLAVLLIVCMVLFVRINSTHPYMRFGRKHDLNSFVREQAKLYPHLRIFPSLGLIDQRLDDPVWGMSLTSRQFAFSHGLIGGWREGEPGSFLPSLDRDRAAAVLREQLGPLWTSAASLTEAEVLLAAIVMPRVAATNTAMDAAAFECAMKRSQAMLEFCWSQFSVGKGCTDDDRRSWFRPAIDMAEPRAVIKEYVNSPDVQRVIRAHAYRRTILYALLLQARALGTLPPCEMRWMRFYARPLWYLVSTVGRQAPFPEAQAVHCHYLYESKAKVPIYEPQIDKALNGLEAALTSYRYASSDRAEYERLHPAASSAA